MKTLIITLLLLPTMLFASINSEMRLSDKGAAFIVGFEGIRLVTYDDGFGFLTIGAGHTGKDVKKGMRITRARVFELLYLDAARFGKHIASQITVRELSQNEYDALSSLEFNCGYVVKGNLARAVNYGNTIEVKTQILKYCHVGKKVVPGLLRRRKAECVLYEDNEY